MCPKHKGEALHITEHMVEHPIIDLHFTAAWVSQDGHEVRGGDKGIAINVTNIMIHVALNTLRGASLDTPCRHGLFTSV